MKTTLAQAVILHLTFKRRPGIVGRKVVTSITRSLRAHESVFMSTGALICSVRWLSPLIISLCRDVLEPYVKHNKSSQCAWKGFGTQEDVLAHWRYKCLTTHEHDHPQEYDGGENPFEGWTHPADRLSNDQNASWVPNAPSSPTRSSPSPSRPSATPRPSPNKFATKSEAKPFTSFPRPSQPFAGPSTSSQRQQAPQPQSQSTTKKHFVLRCSDGSTFMFDDV